MKKEEPGTGGRGRKRNKQQGDGKKPGTGGRGRIKQQAAVPVK